MNVEQQTLAADGADVSARADDALAGSTWRRRFSRSAEREHRLGITPEWLAQYKAGVEEQRAAAVTVPACAAPAAQH